MSVKVSNIEGEHLYGSPLPSFFVEILGLQITMHPFPLTAMRLRFHCAAETHLQLGGLRAGSNLRGALLNVMSRAACAGDLDDPVHCTSCPVCWLVAADDHPGQERRGYVISAPLNAPECLEPGEAFTFHITLFGSAARYLPYFVLAVPEAGRIGVGPGRGRFSLKSIWAEHPLEEDWPVLKEGEYLVRPPGTEVDHNAILQAARHFVDPVDDSPRRLRIDFLTPLRLILDKRLLKSPDFSVMFNHLLRRTDELCIQFSGGSLRDAADRQHLWDLAEQVRLVESQAVWKDISSGSSRTGQQTWISGLVGPAWYRAPGSVWRELMPWLFWGESVQVGKDTTKGNGVYRIQWAVGKD